MNKQELVMSKARNICYYFSIDTRPRSIYMHVIRELREEMKELLGELDKNSPEYAQILSLIRACSQKIKTEECEDYIMNTLRPLFYEQ